MLKDALNSVAAQTYAPIEVIVVNDAGVDVESMISPFKKKQRISYIKHNAHKGLPAARNTGLRAASGEYIAYLDDDDIYYPNHIQTLVSFLTNSAYRVAYTDAYEAYECKLRNFLSGSFSIYERSPRGTMLLYSLSRFAPRWCLELFFPTSSLSTSDCAFLQLKNSGIDMFSRADGEYLIVKRTVQFSNDFDKNVMLVKNFIPVLCLMHHRSCLERTGLFDEKLKTHEDWDLWIRMSRDHDFAHLKKLTCEYTMRDDGTNMTSMIRGDFKHSIEIIHDRYSHFTSSPQTIAAQKAFLQELKDELARAVKY